MPILPDMIGLVVSDMGAALKFYRLLDLDISEGQDAEPYVDCTTSNGYRISWNTVEMVKGIDPDYVPSTGYRMELAFKCESPAGVDAAFNKITAAGYHGHKQPWDAFWGQRYAIVDDPDGNHVSLFAALA